MPTHSIKFKPRVKIYNIYLIVTHLNNLNFDNKIHNNFQKIDKNWIQ